MEKFEQDITNIIKYQYNNINNKLTGLNYLENLKFNLIPNIPIFDKNFHLPINDINIEENDKFKAILKYKDKSNSNEEYTISANTLFVVINGVILIDIYNNSSQSFTGLNIYSSMGLSLPINSLIKLNYPKDSLFVEFLNEEQNNNIENLKNDVI